MKILSFSIIILFCYLSFSLPGGSAYSDIVWTKSFNYSGKIIEEGPDFVIIKMADGVKKISRKNIEDITYSKKTPLPPEQKETIKKAGKSLEKVVQEQLKWRKEHPKEYARQLKEEEEAIKREEAREEARLKKLMEEERREEERVQRLLEEEMRKEEAARRKKLENREGVKVEIEEREAVDNLGVWKGKPIPANPLPPPDE